MTFLQSILLGLIQGLTEFLPVSSSGHLAIFKYLFGVSEVGMGFDVLLHVGTLIAVVAVYYRDIWDLIKALIQIIVSIVRNLVTLIKRLNPNADKFELPFEKVIDTPYKKFALMIIISTIPVGIVGFLIQGYVEKISKGLLVPGICLLITGVVLLLAEAFPSGKKGLKSARYRHAVWIGIAQACAVFPGISRSGSTIAASMMCGFKKSFAVKYSFILSIPAILGAALKTTWDLIQGEGTSDGGNFWIYLAGMVVAAVVGYGAIKLLQLIIKNNRFRWFAFYCFLAGLVAIIGFFATR